MQKVNRQYIIVTPCKNEGDNLPKLIQSVAEQSIRPVLWVIIDDGSTDNTSEIIKEAKEKYRWIKNIRLDSSKRDLGLHYASIVIKGLNFAVEYCKKNGIDYSYVGNLDGDLTLEHTFFENIIREFEMDSKLGVASGGTKHIIGNRVIHAKVEIDEPSGGHMLIRRECFEECEGFPLSYSPDSVLKAKARLRGWKTKRFEKSMATEIRDVHAAEGYWKGYVLKGKSAYYVNLNPIHMLIKSIMYIFIRRPYYIGLAYFLGYFSDFIRRKEQINDDEIKEYFWNKWKGVIKKRLGF